MLHELLGPHPLLEELMLYGYSTLYTTHQQLANYLLVLAKTTVYKIYLATSGIHSHTPDCQRMFPTRLQCRLYTEMHYSPWNDKDTFRGT